MKEFFKKNGYYFLVIITIALVFSGFRIQFEDLSKANEHPENYPIFLLTVSMIGIYLIPFALGIRYLQKKFCISGKIIALSWIVGLTVTVLLGTEGNSALSFLLLQLNLSDEFLKAWGAAITAPFTEEISKGIAVLLVYLLCRKLTLKETLVSAWIAGAGFMVAEDIGYIYQTVFQGMESGFPVIFERISGAMGGHVIFTGLFATGLIILLSKNDQVPKGKALLWLISPVVLHFLWNSPIDFPGIINILGTIGLTLTYHMYKTIEALDEQCEPVMPEERAISEGI